MTSNSSQKDGQDGADSESEEEDYMSDAFLQKLEKRDVKPGLKHSHSSQRKHELEKKRASEVEAARERRAQKRGRAEMEAEEREKGLGTELDATNKGFAMLQKMGYKKGESLGKSGSDGIVNPIGVVVKANRFGLGREAVLKEIREQKEQFRIRKWRQQKESEMTPDEYRAHLSLRSRQNRIQSDVFKSQKVCEQLDKEKGIEEPEELWFWPKPPPPPLDDEGAEEQVAVEEEEEDECEFEPHEQLHMLTQYLRMWYLYCLWCGTKFEDGDDLQANCPGDTRELHDE